MKHNIKKLRYIVLLLLLIVSCDDKNTEPTMFERKQVTNKISERSNTNDLITTVEQDMVSLNQSRTDLYLEIKKSIDSISSSGNGTDNGCTAEIISYPYTQSFENTLGKWTQSTTNDVNWSILSGRTPSNGTGATNAVNGNNYIYVEASGSNVGYPNKRAIIKSPCFDLSGLTKPIFNFKYHQYGSEDMGKIDLEISDDKGANWTSIWDSSGSKGNAWLSANIDLTVYTGQSINLRFNRVTGSTWKADICIDDISLTENQN